MSKNLLFYPTDIKIYYKNDIEYRKVMRSLFQMTCNILSITDDIDEITQDEWNYDSESTTPFMDFIYESTHENPVFQELYKKSAGLMLSEDEGIGLAILFSYDYLELFHNVLCDYFKSGLTSENVYSLPNFSGFRSDSATFEVSSEEAFCPLPHTTPDSSLRKVRSIEVFLRDDKSSLHKTLEFDEQLPSVIELCKKLTR